MYERWCCEIEMLLVVLRYGVTIDTALNVQRLRSKVLARAKRGCHALSLSLALDLFTIFFLTTFPSFSVWVLTVVDYLSDFVANVVAGFMYFCAIFGICRSIVNVYSFEYFWHIYDSMMHRYLWIKLSFEMLALMTAIFNFNDEHFVTLSFSWK